MYLLELCSWFSGRPGDDIVQLEAAEDSPLEELSARIKVAFSLPYNDLGFHSFQANGHIYMQEEHIPQVLEMEFETWEPAYEGHEEPDWIFMRDHVYLPSETATLSDVFTVLGSAVIYRQDFRHIRILLSERFDTETVND
ncbi:MAG: hypothetical protein IJV55_08325 [Paludibacteraceae bacterium]|nr:hypothetical protein [Paludibacteraceae bacterium]MBQ9706172.1 hypothetical protein [Paludibacteraceae bacterium]